MQLIIEGKFTIKEGSPTGRLWPQLLKILIINVGSGRMLHGLSHLGRSHSHTIYTPKAKEAASVICKKKMFEVIANQ